MSVLARSLMAGTPDLDGIESRAVRTLGRRWKWIRPLATRYVEKFTEGTRPRHKDVLHFLRDDAGFQEARRKYGRQLRIAEWIAEPQHMQPVAAAEMWRLPRIESAGDVADWLSLAPGELEWLADLKGLARKFSNPKLRHYNYLVLSKRTGGVRLIERPKRLLKDVQRRILLDLLDRIPPHDAAHGFVKGRSIVSFAAPHVGKQVLLRIDLRDFFPGSPAARVHAMFRTIGYPDSVAALLAGVCTNAVPRDIWRDRPQAVGATEWSDARMLYARPHLPQGAPTSPAIANMMAYRLDCRLAALATAAGATYTRYADDLAFSGDSAFSRVVERFSPYVAAIALEEGFQVNHRKTRIMRPGNRQQLAGVVVNRKLSIRRRDLELLEAILTNCARRGHASQNRDNHPRFREHLEGRIGFVEMVSPEKGQRLRRIFDTIHWDV